MAEASRSAARLAVGVDIGGTKVVAGLVDDGGRVVATAHRSTPGRDVVAVEDTIAGVVDELAHHAPELPVGVGAAGFVSADGATVLFSPHLAWRREPLRQGLSERIGRPVLVDNDANGAAWAEWRFGAGRGESHLVCVTLGTGIGGGIVIDGRLVRGRFGIAGEFGHMVVVPDGLRCECGNRGCWEQYGSGTALVRAAREEAAGGSMLARPLVERAGSVDAIDGPTITEAAQAGDPFAIEQLATLGRWLGEGVASLAAVLDPAVVVVGGGVAAAGDLLMTPLRAAFARELTGRGHRPELEIRVAALGNTAGLIGAADLAREL